MSDRDSDKRRSPVPQGHHFGLWLLLSLGALVGLAGLAMLALTGRMVEMPGWVTERVEMRLNSGLTPAQIRIGGIEGIVLLDSAPRMRFSDVALFDAAGRDLARLPQVDFTLSLAALVQGRPPVTRIALTGADITLRRAPDGQFDLALGRSGAPVSAARSLAEVLDWVDRAFARPMLAPIEAVSVEALGLTYEDARAGRIWRVENGLMTLDQSATDVSLQAFFSLDGGADVSSEFAFNFVSVKGSPAARISASFSDVPSADVASQSPALAPLGLIDAPISGAMRTEIDASGALGPLKAALEIGAGELRPPGGAPPIAFRSGKSYFQYDPERQRLSFDQIALDMDALRLSAEGQAYLGDLEGGWPRTMIAQVAFDEVSVNPPGVFAAPADFASGALDVKLSLAPFAATIGQLVLVDGAQSYRANGLIRALPEGWDVALDAVIDEISRDRLVALWPLTLAPKTRDWVVENLATGMVRNGHAAIRLPPSGRPTVSLSAGFSDATIRFLKTMPPIEKGRGYIVIDRDGFTASAEGGTITPPEGGPLDVTGTVFRVPDIRIEDKTADITLKAAGALTAGLSMIDQPPLRLLQRAHLEPTLAKGHAEVEARLALPIRDRIGPDDVAYDVTGTLSDLQSAVLVPGRVLAADTLKLSARPERVSITGQATLDGLPVRGSWSLVPGAEGEGTNRVEGEVALSQSTNETLGIGLPDGSLDGAAEGRFIIDLVADAPPRLTLNSDLRGLRLSLDGLGWSKPAAAEGKLEVAATLGQPVSVERLALSAPGLSAEGSVSLQPGGGLDAVRLSRLKVGGWLDAPVVLRSGGAGRPPDIEIRGGALDLRAKPPGGGSGEGPGRIDVTLDRVVVTGGIALRDLRGTLSAKSGLSGQLSAQLDGGPPLIVRLTPARHGSTVSVRSDDAGGMLRGTGLYKRAKGGSFELVLVPQGPAGSYDGQAKISNLRVGGTPLAAELLSAISVVGMVELLDGDGLSFSDVEARFALRPGAVEIREASAVGPSLGLSASGVYLTQSKQIDVQGVISPIYMLNSIGSGLTRKGEGLFGFNYRLRGSASDPQVSVNPLSILTPGMFRDIFRSPPPQVRQ